MTLTYKSATAAQAARLRLSIAGIAAYVSKSFDPRIGCYYTLTVADDNAAAVRRLLQTRKGKL